MCVFEKSNINGKEARVGPFFNCLQIDMQFSSKMHVSKHGLYLFASSLST